jgi:hypothetical protein
MSTARHSVKAYRTQRARFADPARVTVGRAGAAFPVAQGEPADRRPKVETPAPSARSVTDSHTVMDCPVMNPHTARSALLE